MAKLILTLDGKIINQYFIDRSSMTIGRDSENEVFIDDPALSRRHARVTRLGADDIVEDLQSRNGTRINGRPLGRHILQHRDVIELGRYQLRYMMSSRNASDTELDRTMIIEGLAQSGETGAAGGKLPFASSARARLAGGWITILAGRSSDSVAGSVVSLTQVVTTFGLAGESLFVLTRRPQGVFLAHVEGAQFPQIGGRSVGDSPVALQDGDVITGAGCRLKFSVEQPAVA